MTRHYHRHSALHVRRRYDLSEDQLVLKQPQLLKMKYTRNEGFETRVHPNSPQGENEAGKRFWTSSVESIAEPQPFSEHEARLASRSNSNWMYRNWSIATASIIGTTVLAAFIFLLYWYIRQKRRRHRMRRMISMSNDAFYASSVTLNEDTSLALDKFLMRDIPPVRTSVMFSRSRSPTLAYVMQNTEQNTSQTGSRYSYDASRSNLTKLDCLNYNSMDEPRSPQSLSDRTHISSLASNILVKKVAVDKPRLSICTTATVAPRSSQVYTLSSGTSTAEESSLLSQDITQTPQSPSQNHPTSSGSSHVLSHASRTSTQLSRSSPRLSTGHSSRRSHVASHRHSYNMSSPLEEASSSSESLSFQV